MVFTIKYRAFRFKFSHHPILWFFWVPHFSETVEMLGGWENFWRTSMNSIQRKWDRNGTYSPSAMRTEWVIRFLFSWFVFLGCAVSCAFLVDEILRNQRASPQILQATSGSGWFRRVAGSSFAALTLSERHRISGRKGGEGGESISDVGSSKRNQDKLGWQQAEVEERPLGGNAA